MHRQICQNTQWWTSEQYGNWEKRYWAKGDTNKRRYGQDKSSMQSITNKTFNKKESHQQTQNQENIIWRKSGRISWKAHRLCYY